MDRPSRVKVVPLTTSPWKCKSSMPPKAPVEVRCCCCAWALLPPVMKPPAERSSQLLYELVPPSKICSGVSATGDAAGALVSVSAAETVETAALMPRRVDHQRLRCFCKILNDFIALRG